MPRLAALSFPGPAQALAAAALFGASTPVAKRLLDDVQPVLLAGLLYLGSGLGLSLLKLTRGGSRAREAALRRADWPWLGLAVLAGGVVAPILLMHGLARSGAASTALLLNLEAALTALLAWSAFGEPVDRRIAAGMLAIVAGGAVLASGAGWSAGDLAGPLAVAGACLAWAVDNNATRWVSGADPLTIALVKGWVAGAVNTLLALGLGASIPGVGALGGALAVGAVAYGISLALFVLALRHMGAARTGAYFSIAPFMGAAVAVIALHERVTIHLLAAGALMALGVYLHLTERHDHEHDHEALAHDHRHVHDEHHQHAHAHDTPTPAAGPHSHWHVHADARHQHGHFPDLHHRHRG